MTTVSSLTQPPPPYAVYGTNMMTDDTLQTLEEPFPSYLYISEAVVVQIVLGSIDHRTPLPLRRIHIPLVSNQFPPPPPFDSPFVKW